MNLKNDPWIVTEPLIGKERELVFILLDSAGIRVFPTLRQYNPVLSPDTVYIGYSKEHGHVFGCIEREIEKYIHVYRIYTGITIEQLKQELIKMIKS